MEAATPVPTAKPASGAPDRSGRAALGPAWLAPAVASLGLLAIVASSFGIAAGAAGGPTSFVPARAGGWPGWLAGPLSGLGLSISAGSFQTLMLAMCAGYGVLLITGRSLPGRVIWSRHRARPRDPAAGTAAALPGRLRLPVLCPYGGAARPGPVHPDTSRSPHRRRLRLHRLALPALPLWPAVHARQLCGSAAGRGGRALGDEDRDGARQPRGDRADRRRRAAHGP